MPRASVKVANVSKCAGRPVTQTNRSAGRRAAFFFVLRFVALMLVFYAITMVPWFREQLFPYNLRTNAAVASGVLRLMGEEARSDGAMVVSPRFALEIRRGCEAIEPAALFIAAVLAFPATWRPRLAAIVVGVASIIALNLVRIVTLYYAGVHMPQHFETIHLEVWQTMFVISTFALWLWWAWWISRPPQTAALPSAAP